MLWGSAGQHCPIMQDGAENKELLTSGRKTKLDPNRGSCKQPISHYFLVKCVI